MRSCWASQPKHSTSKRWKSAVSPPVHSRVVEVDGVDAGAGEGGRPLLGPVGHVAEEGRVDQAHLGGTPAASWPPAPSPGGRARAAPGRRRRPPGRRRPCGRRRPRPSRRGDSSRSVPTSRRARPGWGCGRAAPPGRSAAIGRFRRPCRTTPSWSSTASPSRVSHTSLSSPVAPSRTARTKASSVFSGALARAPRCANPIGGRRSDGSRVGTTAHCGRRAQASWWSSRHLERRRTSQ